MLFFLVGYVSYCKKFGWKFSKRLDRTNFAIVVVAAQFGGNINFNNKNVNEKS